MLKLTVLMHMLIGTLFAGIAVIVITTVPSLYDNGMKLILPAAIIAAVVAIIPSMWVAKAILARTNGA